LYGGDQAKQTLPYSAIRLYSKTEHITQLLDKAVPLTAPVWIDLVGFLTFFPAAQKTNK